MPQIEATPLRLVWGRRIQQARKARNLSLNALARCARVDAGNLSRIERGLQRASEDHRSRIAASLGVPVDELFAQDDHDGRTD